MTTRARGFAMLLVFGVIVVATFVLAMAQSAALSQASSGRSAIARTRALWAARAGLEQTIARLEAIAEEADTSDAFRALDESVQVAEGSLEGAGWVVRAPSIESVDQSVLGVLDSASKLNVHRLGRDALLEIEPLMRDDVADSLLDWIDADDDTRELGAEIGYYKSQAGGPEPRNATLSSIAEVELIAGVDASDVRGEDWNQNGLLDPEEDDGDASWPPDNADGQLDRAWSGILTVHSRESSLGASGEERLDITRADAGQLVQRLGVTQDQANEIVEQYRTNPNISIAEFIRTTLPRLAQQRVRRQGGSRQDVRRAGSLPELTRDQLAALVDECSEGTPAVQSFVPGKLNVNTCTAQTLELLEGVEAELADAIVAERSSRSTGFASVIDLLDVSGMTPVMLSLLYDQLTVRSNVYEVCSTGRDDRTGFEVQVIAVVDTSTLPASLREVRVR